MLGKMKNKEKVISLICLILAVVLAGGLFIYSSTTKDTVEIIAVKNDITKGQLISKDDVEKISVGNYGLPAGTITNMDDVINNYAVLEMRKGDYLFKNKISSENQGNDTQFASLSAGKVAVSFTVPSLAAGLSNKLQPGDVIRIYSTENKTLQSYKELQFVQVIAVSSSEGADVKDDTTTYSTITVAASVAQAEKIIELESAGTIYTMFITRNSTDAEQLLAKQDSYLS